MTLISRLLRHNHRTLTTVAAPPSSSIASELTAILHETPHQKWQQSLTPLLPHIHDHHINHLILTTQNHPKLVLRFFNYLTLHLNYYHSLSSYSILIHSLSQSRLFFPASSLLHTLTFVPHTHAPGQRAGRSGIDTGGTRHRYWQFWLARVPEICPHRLYLLFHCPLRKQSLKHIPVLLPSCLPIIHSTLYMLVGKSF